MKRTLSLLLLLVLLLSAAGCTGDTDNNLGTTADTPSTTPVGDVESPNAEAQGISFPLAETKTFSVFSANGNDVDDPNEMLMFQEAEERMNIHIEWYAESNATVQEKFNLSITSGLWNDCYLSSYWAGGIGSALEQEIVLDLQELIPVYAPDYLALVEGSERYSREARTDSGEMPYVVNMFYSHLENEYQEFPSYMGYWVREDWLNEIGMTATELTTIDEWETVLAAFKANGMGSTAPLSVFGAAANNIMAAWDICSGFYQVDGQVHYGMAEDGHREYLRTMIRWYEAGYLDPDFLTNSGWAAMGNTDRYQDGFGLWVGGHNEIVDFYKFTTNEQAQILAVPDPVLEEGAPRRINHLTNGGTNMSGASITTSCTDPATMLAWLNYWFTPEGSMLNNWGVEGVTFTWKEGHELPYFVDDILHNPDMGVTTARRTYIDWVYLPRAAEWKEGWPSDAPEYEFTCCTDIWDGNLDNTYTMPTVSMTAEESAAYAELYVNISTYADEMCARFLTGVVDIDDDAQWEMYLDTLQGEEFRLGELLEIYQGALDRYYAR